VPCPEGIVALKLAAGPTFSKVWTGASIHPGPPIVAGGVVWSIDTAQEQSKILMDPHSVLLGP